MTKRSSSAKLALLGAGLLVLTLAGWFALIAPKRSEAAKVQQQIDDTQAQIVARQRAPAHQRAPQIRVADLFELSRAMPNQTDIPSVLLQLSDIASETGVSFQSIRPHDPVPLLGYQQIGIELVFEGRFYDLSDFLYRLRNLVTVRDGVLAAAGRLFTVDSIAYEEGDLQFPQVRARLTVSAYVFGDGTAAPVPAGALSADTQTTTTAPAPATPATEDTTPIPAAPPGATAAGA
jgi:Tfp pilus assembly protein PilO